MITRRYLLPSIVFGLTVLGAGQALSDEKKKEEKKKGGGETFIQITEINVFMPRARRRNGVLSIGINLDIADASLRARAKALMPRLRDAYLTRLQTYALSLPPQGLVDTEYVRAEIQKITDTQLKSNGAHVLFGSVMTN